MSKSEENWQTNYEALKAYIDEHHHLPDKHKETDRNKLSWWKYQMKKKKTGTLTDEQEYMLQKLVGSRSMTCKNHVKLSYEMIFSWWYERKCVILQSHKSLE